MEDSENYGLGTELDFPKLLQEAQRRWLRPTEICEILRNYKIFRVASEPANMPPSGSIFIYDRKVLRYFRKDGHNWRKKKDGKTVREAHERLKARSVDVLHCYYAHGEDNESFQRRTYWLLEEELSHIVLVHYLEVKGNRTNSNNNKENGVAVPYFQENDDGLLNSDIYGSGSSSFQPNNYHTPSQRIESLSLDNILASEHEDAQSDDYHQKFRASFGDGFNLLFPEDNTEERNANSLDYHSGNEVQEEWQTCEGNSSRLVKRPLDQIFHSVLANDASSKFHDQPYYDNLLYSMDASRTNSAKQIELEKLLSTPTHDFYENKVSDYSATVKGKTESAMFDASSTENLKKMDSFNKWMDKELGDVTDSHMQSTSGAYWDAIENENAVDSSNISHQVHSDIYMLSPSLSLDQLFSIIDFSPNWAYVGSEIKVLVIGRFLKSRGEAEHCKWSCMFGEVEVPAEVIANGVLRCHAPTGRPGRVPFYVTCSNRLACSEIREFEFRAKNVDTAPHQTIGMIEVLRMRFGKLLCEFTRPPGSDPIRIREQSQLSSKISQLLKDDGNEWDQMLTRVARGDFSLESAQEWLLQRLLKDRLYTWLWQRAAEGKSPSVLDEGGQGVVHFAAALGYDWAIRSSIIAGVNVNFRDVNGWTALHWAAFSGRERTVATLISLGAAPGAVTDPSAKHPSGRTPADLASANGHKGIAGFLAESALSAHLSSLQFDQPEGNAADASGEKPDHMIAGQISTPASERDRAGLSLEGSLAAVKNAIQAAARIHQAFRMQSFQRKQMKELEITDDKSGMSDEHAMSLISVKNCKRGPRDEPVRAAAIRIQNKFRSWKGRKEFLVIRQKIVKIQAHVRGHQVRKNYKNIIWSVGILEKIILRWRRKGSGLRGFKPEALPEGPTMEGTSSKEDDDDFLKEGRKQTEERLQIALARVKSMVQYPEARDQYSRLLIAVSEIQDTKGVKGMSSDETADFDDLIDIGMLLAEDTLMPTET